MTGKGHKSKPSSLLVVLTLSHSDAITAPFSGRELKSRMGA